MEDIRLSTRKEFSPGSGLKAFFHSLPALEAAGFGTVSRLPVSLRIVLESLLRHCDGKKVTLDHVRQLARWQPVGERSDEIPFVVARIVLQDFTGVPLLCDLAAMRGVAASFGKNPKIIEPLVPVDLVVDHSVQVDHFREADALDLNMKLEFHRNAERYRFIKWGMQAFDTFRVVPPGIGIVHQVNLEYLARGVYQKDGVYYPDSLVGTDSHTTMINALGVVGWGVGGIEAEAGMLGQPIYFLTPDVVGVHLAGQLQEGVTATDLVLVVTEMLRKAKVVGKFVEFFGAGAASLTLPDRATIANMAPEYGATMGFFPPDEETAAYLTATGRSEAEVEAFRAYFQAQQMFGMPESGQIDYSTVLTLDLTTVVPSVAGPKRPQDRIALPELKARFADLFSKPAAENGYGKAAATLGERHALPYSLPTSCLPAEENTGKGKTMARNEVEMVDTPPGDGPSCPSPENFARPGGDIGHGDVVIAAITSCTNTSNPGVMLAAGLLAQKAVALGLTVHPRIKTSLAPGSRVVSEYLSKAGLLEPLSQLGFRVVAYGCTTCIGNSGPLEPRLEEVLNEQDLVCAAVLSGNRNFEARIHGSIKANFLMSPPLVVAFAIAGKIGIDLAHEPLGNDREGHPGYLRDIWPSQAEIGDVLRHATDPATYRRLYADFSRGNPLWNDITTVSGQVYAWEPSTYIAEPPFFAGFALTPLAPGAIHEARALAIFGDSVTTDHISPAGSIKASSPAGLYLRDHGVSADEFNSYGSRRGNHEVMMRGTFANIRIRNRMMPPKEDGSPVEGGFTLHQPDGRAMPIYDAAMAYQQADIPTIIFAGEEYGTGSSRDWAAKGTRLLGVKAVVARSFERIHRSNLVGMGVLPLQFLDDDSAETLQLKGDEVFDVRGLENGIAPRRELTLSIQRSNGHRQEIPVLLRIDTDIEVDYYEHGGILPYVLRELLAV
ncbi:MAG TPA: aconitate hydratase [Rhodocyclaceae bacterium]|jgi:aconitate hydratase